MIDKNTIPQHWKIVRSGDFAKTEKGRKPKDCFFPKVSQQINFSVLNRKINEESGIIKIFRNLYRNIP